MRAASQPQAQLVERRARSAARGTPARRVLTGYALCLPAFLVVFAVLIYPVLYDAAVSLTDARDFEAGGDFVGFANYARALADPLYWEAARNTMVLVVVTSAVEVLVGAVTALLLGPGACAQVLVGGPLRERRLRRHEHRHHERLAGVVDHRHLPAGRAQRD